MTKKQKLILAILAIMNVLVIGGMAYVIWPRSQPKQDIPVLLTPCELAIQKDFSSRYTISQSLSGIGKEQLTIILSGQYPHPSSDDKQSLWQILDQLKPISVDACTNIETFTVHLHVEDGVVYTFAVQGADLRSWAKQTIDDSTLANRIAFRETEQN